jgi:hypothetical protein
MARANFIRLTYEAPPWVADPLSYDFWVRLPVAGEYYFRRSYKAIRAMLERREFDDIFATYFDGSRWWIKLPVSLEELRKTIQNEP